MNDECVTQNYNRAYIYRIYLQYKGITKGEILEGLSESETFAPAIVVWTKFHSLAVPRSSMRV